MFHKLHFIFSILFASFLLSIFLALPAAAANEIYYTPQVTIPGSEFLAGGKTLVKNDTGLICNYIIAIYKYAIGIVGVIAVMAIAIGGVIWIVSGWMGAIDKNKVSEAKAWITSGLSGLILALASFLILATISRDLVTCQLSSIPSLARREVSTANVPGRGFGENYGIQGQRCQEPSQAFDSSGKYWCCVLYGDLDGSGLLWDDAYKRCATFEATDKTTAQNECNKFYDSFALSKADRSGMAQSAAIIHTSPFAGLFFGPLAIPVTIATALYGASEIDSSANSLIKLETRNQSTPPANPDNQSKNTAAVYQGRCWEIPQVKKWCQGSECPGYCRTKGDGYACVISGTDTWGYCQGGTCKKCKKHCEACNNNYECPSQKKNPDKNGVTGIICGEEIYSFWGTDSGDCASNKCDREFDINGDGVIDDCP